MQSITNPWYLFNHSIFNTHRQIIEHDRSQAWCTDREQSFLVQNELDMQENYMRRMIAHAMDVIGTFSTIHQAFTSNELVSLIFSISPICRNFDTYFHIFQKLDPALLEIPWARTGVSLSEGFIDNNQSHMKEYHNYPVWFLEDFYQKVKQSLLDGQLVKNEILCRSSLKYLFHYWKKSPALSELFSKLYQIELLIDRFKLKVEKQKMPIKNRLQMLALSIYKNMK